MQLMNSEYLSLSETEGQRQRNLKVEDEQSRGSYEKKKEEGRL